MNQNKAAVVMVSQLRRSLITTSTGVMTPSLSISWSLKKGSAARSRQSSSDVMSAPSGMNRWCAMCIRSFKHSRGLDSNCIVLRDKRSLGNITNGGVTSVSTCSITPSARKVSKQVLRAVCTSVLTLPTKLSTFKRVLSLAFSIET